MNTPSSQSPDSPKRILIVDDHPIFREGLVGVIKQQPDFVVCGEAENVTEAIKAIQKLQPDLLLTDLSLPGKSGLDLLSELQTMHLELPTLVISMHDEMQYAGQVLRAGGQGYIMKQAGPDKVLEAIATVLAGGMYVSKNVAGRLPSGIVRRRPSSGVIPRQ